MITLYKSLFFTNYPGYLKICSPYDLHPTICAEIISCRTQNNGRSTDNVRPDRGLDWSNSRLAGHFWMWTFNNIFHTVVAQYVLLYNAVMISFFFGFFCCLALTPLKKKNDAINFMSSCRNETSFTRVIVRYIMMQCNWVKNARRKMLGH